ncbi:hypothetical protein PN398_07940 [Romboutsia sp. 1001216sp1]|uniref:hypothetical protein n=1 Tax=unclassified Romboutsia TaxID=2626894 RepID=UPI00189AF004|nr:MULTISPECIES: hypothetical protein [unclassified Romboutsia]MDB8790649.1 hypothetical protein [Romboutsia sp. 1001216sp1]MDB8803268.1 hypothetical protein [Romboutsia sp. 1001216sp1]MDB8814624.1 hypothetical protein [Romboutsia sp. 1001216sp1]
MNGKIENIKNLLKGLNEEVENGACFTDKEKMEYVYDIAQELANELEPDYWFWLKQDKENRNIE